MNNKRYLYIIWFLLIFVFFCRKITDNDKDTSSPNQPKGIKVDVSIDRIPKLGEEATINCKLSKEKILKEK